MSEYTVEELEQMLAEAKAKKEHVHYPKWITPHESHLVKQGDSISAPPFSEVHVGRDESVTVLVADADEEALAVAAKQEAPAEQEPLKAEVDPI